MSCVPLDSYHSSYDASHPLRSSNSPSSTDAASQPFPSSSSKVSVSLLFVILSTSILIAILALVVIVKIDVGRIDSSVDQLIDQSIAQLSIKQPIVCDVAIVGAGVGGLWSGTRLLNSSLSPALPPLRVCMFDLAAESGGRLRSRHFDGAPHCVIELGGMQIAPHHRMVFDVAAKAGVAIFKREWPKQNFDYLRSKVVKDDGWTNGQSPFYLTAAEQKVVNASGPGGLVDIVIASAGIDVAVAPYWSTCQWQEWKSNGLYAPTGEHVNRVGWWYALAQVLSDEGVAAYRDSFGYDSFVEEANLADVLAYVVKGYSTTDEGAEHRFKDGYQTITNMLTAKFQQLNGIIYYNAELITSTPIGGSINELTFRDGRVAHARSVIYALTQPSLLRLVSPGVSLSTPAARVALNSVRPVHAFKMFLAFDAPWWTPYGFATGEMKLSSPIRKLYYWAIESTFGGDVNNTNSVMLAAYNDDDAASYWSNIVSGDGVESMSLEPMYFAPNPHYTSVHSYLSLSSADPRVVLVRDLLRQIRRAHSGVVVPDPYAAAFMDWSSGATDAAWHAWNVGADSSQARRTLRQPAIGNTPVCGEAFSDEQGWVEGALRSCEKMMIEQFGLESEWDEYLQCS